MNGRTGGGGEEAGSDEEPGWHYETVVLSRAGGAGLGFSIAGGTDNPHVAGDSRVYVTKLISGGAAASSSLRINDVILRVNNTSLVGVCHAEAVDALKRAGTTVKLVGQCRRLFVYNLMGFRFFWQFSATSHSAIDFCTLWISNPSLFICVVVIYYICVSNEF